MAPATTAASPLSIVRAPSARTARTVNAPETKQRQQCFTEEEETKKRGFGKICGEMRLGVYGGARAKIEATEAAEDPDAAAADYTIKVWYLPGVPAGICLFY